MSAATTGVRVCVVDTETTGLHPDRRAWDIAVIVREPGRPDDRHQWYVRADDLDLGNASRRSLDVGRFYERHPEYQSRPYPHAAKPEGAVLREVERLTRDAYILGAVPSFDADVLGRRMREHGILPSWDHHLADIEAMASGWLHAQASSLALSGGVWAERAADMRVIASPPWDHHALSRAANTEPDDYDRHTALGDCAWTLAIWDVITAGAAIHDVTAGDLP